MIINSKLSQLAQITVIPQQRGFVRNRRMCDNVIDIDATALHLEEYFDHDAGVILFDFAAAFPSLSHRYIFAALHKLGVPPRVLRAINALYLQCNASISLEGCGHARVEMQAGIKQGCPASGSIFALSLDPFLRMMLTKLPKPISTFGAFADDVAAAVAKLLHTLEQLAPIFRIFAAASGLHLNPKKTLIIPIGKLCPTDVRKFLKDHIPEWAEMTVTRAGKLLGVAIGPDSLESRWNDAGKKYWSTCRASRSSTGGFWQALRHYRVFAFSVLCHIAQFDNIPKHIRRMETLALQCLTKGPIILLRTLHCSASQT
jgi:hypothetical protein